MCLDKNLKKLPRAPHKSSLLGFTAITKKALNFHVLFTHLYTAQSPRPEPCALGSTAICVINEQSATPG